MVVRLFAKRLSNQLRNSLSLYLGTTLSRTFQLVFLSVQLHISPPPGRSPVQANSHFLTFSIHM